MLKLVWFIPRPEDIEEFEDWYQNEHIPTGMRQEFLQKFRVSRSFYPQPAFVAEANGTKEPRSYRFSEGYWQTLEDIRRCYVSVHGRAALGDGTVNRPPPKVAPPPSPVLIVEEEILPVSRGRAFSILNGRYDAPLACKLFGFVRLPADKLAAFDARWALRFFGHYEPPVSPFQSELQPDLAREFARRAPPPLPFGLGYHMVAGSSNLLVASKVSG